MPLQPAAASLPEDSGLGNSGRYLFFGLGLLMVSINATIVAVGIPTLTTALNTSLNWVSGTLTSYRLVQIAAMPVLGGLSDS
ncbi:MAG: MFS transporter, partial [Dehalococcoidia bacterium]|nr:MFS transporter [Dehalococcoidia bacterium]